MIRWSTSYFSLVISTVVLICSFVFVGFTSIDYQKRLNSWFDQNEPPGKSYGIRKIVIDAGHGGHDPGCVGQKSKEKDIALAISLKIGAILQRELKDVEIIYTRTKDVFLELHQRASIANRNNADLFISIHCNSTESKTPFGTETFVLGLYKAKDNLDVAKRENASIYFERDYEHHYEGYDPNSPQGHILLSLFQNAYLDQSIFLAEKIERNFVANKRSSRGVKQGGFLVLRHATMPAVLVEAGFLSNPEEERWLMSEEGQLAIASSVAQAVKAYKESYDVRPKASQNNVSQEILAQVSEEAAILADHVVFCVQIASSPDNKKPVEKKLNELGNMIWRLESGVYKLQLHGIATYEESLLLRDRIRALGYKDAFVTAYKGDQKISVSDAIALSVRIAQN